MTDDQYMGLFMGGLKKEIKLKVQTLDPPNQYKAISMARNVERKLIKASRGGQNEANRSKTTRMELKMVGSSGLKMVVRRVQGEL